MQGARARVLWVALGVAVGALALDRFHLRAEKPEAAAEPSTLTDGVPGPDIVTVPASLVSPAPRSEWVERRTRRYAALFDGTHCDTLLVPLQIEGAGLDRPNRDLMSADLAAALASTGGCVTDPFLTDLALGEGQRQRDDRAVLAFARAIGAHEIVRVFAGHYAPQRMRVTLQIDRIDTAQSGAAPTRIAARSFDDLPYSDEAPPFLAFRARIPQMLAAVGRAGAGLPPAQPAGPMPASFPRAADAFMQPAAAGPLADAANLAFLGAIAPEFEWNATLRLFAKAWIALEPAGDADPAVRRLRARILFHLQERPYALKLLQDQHDPAADGLRAVLNGDLPSARRAFAMTKDPWERLFLGLELDDLELYDGRDAHSVRQSVQDLIAATDYAPLIALRLQDSDAWAVGYSPWIEWFLAHSWPPLHPPPMPADAAEADIAMVALRHVHWLVEQAPRQWCCGGFNPRPAPSDLLDLLDARATFTLGEDARFLLEAQGQPDEALRTLARYAPELDGEPCAEALRAEIDNQLLREAQTARQKALGADMHRAARLALWWDRAQSDTTATALPLMEQAPPDPALRYFERLNEDVPLRGYWPAHGVNAAARLPFSTDDARPLLQLIANSRGETRAGYQQQLETRFVGHYQATATRTDGLAQDAVGIDQIRRWISEDPDNWALYRALAARYFYHSRYAELEQAVLSYPPFSEPRPANAVELSNKASEWGHDLLWVGALHEARPLLARAAAYHTGSAAGLYSAARVALLDGNYTEAAKQFLGPATAYGDLTAYREFDSLAFASGNTQDAWALFDRIVARYTAAGFWTAALVGHRRDRMSSAEVAHWFHERLAVIADPELRENLRGSALLEQIVDRQPDAGVAAAMAQLVDTVPRQNAHGPAGAGPGASGASQIGSHRRTAGSASSARAEPDRFALAAEGFVAFGNGKWQDAVSAFDRLAADDKIEESELSFVLPYFAVAAARSGDTLHLRDDLDRLPDRDRGSDVTLARAAFAGLAGERDTALGLLENALHQWSWEHTAHFPLSAYQYLATCTWIFEGTHDDAYRQAALQLARTLRRAEPAFAYGHALVGYLGEQRQERIDALTAALALDPASRWAAAAPSDDLAAARAQLAQGANPFAFRSDALVKGELTRWDAQTGP